MTQRHLFRHMVHGLACACLILTATAGAEEPVNSPLAPVEAIGEMQLAVDVTIELVAAEPNVIDPVAIRFDEHARLWVVEMSDYPHGPTEGETPRSRIRMLSDQDHDGIYETATTFADGLLFATGIQPWDGGLFATIGGKVIYLKDTDNDGRADVNETWFTGFAEENSQLRANHPRLGLDGWIYVANGLRGGGVVGQQKDDKEIDLRGADFRFHPRTRAYEAISGPGQFGLTFDRFGNRFVCSNRHPLDHVVLPRRYQQRNRLAPLYSPLEEVAAAGEASRIYPISDFWTTSNLHAGQFTAACGVMIQRGSALPARYRNSALTCDPTGNLIHAESLEASGATFTAKPIFEEREFIASRDTWFRPVNLETGPDGATYIVDMYRAVIEHPQFMPTELKERPDLHLGNDRGRIYRLVGREARLEKAASLADASNDDLLDLLGNDNAWHADTAVRLLYQRTLNAADIERLRTMATSDANAASRYVAMHLLSANDALDTNVLTNVIADGAPNYDLATAVRRAIELAEPHLATDAALRQLVLDSLDSDSPLVRFQAALSLSGSKFDPRRLAPIFWDHPHDAWLQRAVLISVGDQSAALLTHLVSTADWSNRNEPLIGTQRYVLTELARMAVANADTGRTEAVLTALTQIPSVGTHLPLRFELAQGVANRMAKNGKSLSLYKRHANSELREPVVTLLGQAIHVAADPKAPAQLRTEALALLAHDSDASSAITRLALESESPTIQAAAINALARQAPIDPWHALLNDFPQLSPQVRVAILDGTLRNVERTKLLLEAVDAGVLNLGEIDPLRMQLLTRHKDDSVRATIKRMLDERYPEERKAAIAAHQRALKLTGDPLKGREVFKKNCASCHRIAGIGTRIGPDISDSRTKNAAQLLTDILEPNLAIDANYVGYSVQTEDGKVLSGLIEATTDDRVTLRLPEKNTTVTLMRDEIAQMISTGASLMPEGFEKNIPVEDMADLIAFIKNWRYLDGSVPVDTLEPTTPATTDP